MSSKMSTGLSTIPRRDHSRPEHSSIPKSAFSSASSSSDALSESSEESSDGASSGPSDRVSTDFSRPQRPLFAFGNQGPVFSFGTAMNSTSSDRLPPGRKSQKKKGSRGDEGHNTRPKNTQIPATGRTCYSGVGDGQLVSHRSRPFQPPLFTFFHRLEQEAPLFTPSTDAMKSRAPILDQHRRSPKRRTSLTDDSKSKDRRSLGSHREVAFVYEGESLESDGGQTLKDNTGSIKWGTRKPDSLRSLEPREQERFPAFLQSKRSDEQRGENPIPVIRSPDNLRYGQRETSPGIMIREGRNPTVASRTGFSERHTKTGEGFKIVSGPVYMTGGADGGEGLRHFDEMNDWWEQELLNQTEPQPPDLRGQADFDRLSSVTASLKPILKNSRSSFRNDTTPAHSNPVRFVDSEGKLYWTLDN